MTLQRTIGLAMLVGAAIAVPATIVLAGGGGNVVSGDVSRQNLSSTGKLEAGKNWKPVPDLGVVSTPGAVAVTVSAQMTKGAAKFRIVPIGGGPAIQPGIVLFTAKAANAFTWATEDTCGQGEQHRIEWKRAGTQDAVARKLTSHSVFDDFCF